MKRAFIIAAAMLLSAPLAAQTVPPGQIGTIERGRYNCELPGNVNGSVGVAQPDASFEIENASRYAAPQGGGTYLRRGDTVTFTSGARQGESYRVISPTFLRRIENGQPGRLRCIRSGR
ncbi:MAG: elongation factor P [Croceibacterium sp.]